MLFSLKSKFLGLFFLGGMIVHGAVSGMDISTLLQSRIPQVKAGVARSLSALSEDTRRMIKMRVMETLAERYSPQLVSLAEDIIGVERDHNLVVDDWNSLSPQNCESFTLLLDSLVLGVNDELLRFLTEGNLIRMLNGVEEFGDGFRLVNSNIECSRTFARGGWLMIAPKGFLKVRIEFNSVSKYSWLIKNVAVDNVNFFSNSQIELLWPETVPSVFGNTQWSVVHADPNYSLNGKNVKFLSLCAKGQGQRIYNVSFLENGSFLFMFVGDLISSNALADNNHFSCDYFDATIDTGTFVNAQKSVQVKSKMPFGQACQAFMDGMLGTEELFLGS